METTLKIKLKPFTVPNFVVEDLIPQGAVNRSDLPEREPMSLPLSHIDSITLEMMCDEFRREVFKKAGKDRPVQAAPD